MYMSTARCCGFEGRSGLEYYSIIDPVFTGGILVCHVAFLRKKRLFSGCIPFASFICLVWFKANDVTLEELALSRDHGTLLDSAKPSIGNLFVWRESTQKAIFTWMLSESAIRPGAKVYSGAIAKGVDLPALKLGIETGSTPSRR